MRGLAQGLVMIAVFVAAHIVGGGVVLILGHIWKQAFPDYVCTASWFVIGVMGVLAAYIFMRGAILGGKPLIQWPPGQRGG